MAKFRKPRKRTRHFVSLSIVLQDKAIHIYGCNEASYCPSNIEDLITQLKCAIQWLERHKK